MCTLRSCSLLEDLSPETCTNFSLRHACHIPTNVISDLTPSRNIWWEVRMKLLWHFCILLLHPLRSNISLRTLLTTPTLRPSIFLRTLLTTLTLRPYIFLRTLLTTLHLPQNPIDHPDSQAQYLPKNPIDQTDSQAQYLPQNPLDHTDSQAQYFPRHPILDHFEAVFFPSCETPSFAPLKEDRQKFCPCILISWHDSKPENKYPYYVPCILYSL